MEKPARNIEDSVLLICMTCHRMVEVTSMGGLRAGYTYPLKSAPPGIAHDLNGILVTCHRCGCIMEISAKITMEIELNQVEKGTTTNESE